MVDAIDGVGGYNYSNPYGMGYFDYDAYRADAEKQLQNFRGTQYVKAGLQNIVGMSDQDINNLFMGQYGGAAPQGSHVGGVFAGQPTYFSNGAQYQMIDPAKYQLSERPEGSSYQIPWMFKDFNFDKYRETKSQNTGMYSMRSVYANMTDEQVVADVMISAQRYGSMNNTGLSSDAWLRNTIDR